jgi:hypothetical protein
LAELDTGLIRDSAHQCFDFSLTLDSDLLALNAPCHTLIVSRDDVEIFELLLKLLHDCAYLLQIHTLQGSVHTSDRLCHGAGNSAHGDGSLHSSGYGIDAGGECQKLDALLAVPYRVGGIQPCDLGLWRSLGQGFLEFGLFGAAVSVCFCRLSIELL